MQYLFQHITPLLLNTAKAVRMSTTPPNVSTKLEITTGPPKSSRGPHSEAVEARMWTWPHAPPENAVGLSHLLRANRATRDPKANTQRAPRLRSCCARLASVCVTPYLVRGRFGLQSPAPEFRDGVQLIRANVLTSPKSGNIICWIDCRAVGLDGLRATYGPWKSIHAGAHAAVSKGRYLIAHSRRVPTSSTLAMSG
jgi:hypothetical protein